MENKKPTFEELFERPFEYPDFELQERLNKLVGLEDQKNRLTKILGLLVNPIGIEKWAKKHHPDAKRIVSSVLKRPPLVVLQGDVGSGKSELAMTIGDMVARQEKISLTLLGRPRMVGQVAGHPQGCKFGRREPPGVEAVRPGRLRNVSQRDEHGRIQVRTAWPRVYLASAK